MESLLGKFCYRVDRECPQKLYMRERVKLNHTFQDKTTPTPGEGNFYTVLFSKINKTKTQHKTWTSKTV